MLAAVQRLERGEEEEEEGEEKREAIMVDWSNTITRRK